MTEEFQLGIASENICTSLSVKNDPMAYDLYNKYVLRLLTKHRIRLKYVKQYYEF